MTRTLAPSAQKASAGLGGVVPARAFEAPAPLPVAAARHRLPDIDFSPVQACGCGKHYEKPVQGKIEAAQAKPLRTGPGLGRPLPDGVRSKMERSFGQDFSSVRVHVGSAAESIGAKAFTRGSEIHFKPGSYDPSSTSGQELLGHELTHVVQQSAGRVAVPQGKGAPINADPHLESEADRGGQRAARGLGVSVSGVTRPTSGAGPVGTPGA